MSNMLSPIEISDKVSLEVETNDIKVSGPLGELQHRIPDCLELDYDQENDELFVKGNDENQDVRSLHGLHHSLISNMLEGVTKGFKKDLEIHGTGYGADIKGKNLVLKIGFCHNVKFEIPEQMDIEIEQNNAQPDNPARFTIKGIDKQKVGQFAATVRDVRPPEPYKGKGIRYADEHVRRKEGKAFAGLE
ncbi:MAG: 50S ribosomal protein L6 [Candidatus Brocadiia bacterium]